MARHALMRRDGERMKTITVPSDKGRLYCMCWLLAEELRHIEGEADLDDGGFAEIYGILGRRYGPNDPLNN